MICFCRLCAGFRPVRCMCSSFGVDRQQAMFCSIGRLVPLGCVFIQTIYSRLHSSVPQPFIKGGRFMKFRRFVSLLLCVCLMLCAAGASAASYNANLTMRLSTRTGPSTAYTEPGTFFSNWQGVSVKVFSKAWGNEVWWVQVEFSNGGKLYRAYTGAKRVDLNVAYLPEETVLGTATVRLAGDVNAYYGPGEHYAPMPSLIPWNASGTVIAAENGFVQFDYTDPSGLQCRAWVPADYLDIRWHNGQPSGAQLPTFSGIASGERFYADNGADIWCDVVSIGPNGGYSYVTLHFYGNTFYGVPVYMESHLFGSIQTSGGGGTVTFLDDGVFLEAYFPDHGISEVLRLSR